MEFNADVASIFCIEFYTDRSIRIAEPSAILSIIFERFNWHGIIGSTLAMVVFSHIVVDRHHWHDVANTARHAFRRHFQEQIVSGLILHRFGADFDVLDCRWHADAVR